MQPPQEEKGLHPVMVNETGVWPHRFCHINDRSISELARKGYVRGLTDDIATLDQCHGCRMGKSTKMPCKKLDVKQSEEILELLHSDLCGPMPIASEGGSRYFMTITDDYTRKIGVLFLKSKDEAPNKIKEYIDQLENEKGEKVKRFRSDNGLEYCNRTLQGFFTGRGIRHERTCVETPQMNGVAERANRTLLDMVRSMLFSAKLPQTFWAEAVATAAYVRNRMIHSNVQGGVPEGLWMGRQPSVRHLKVFGCLAYGHLPAQGRKKLEPRARACVFVGYSNRTKGYRLWDPSTKDVVHTKHVRFDEGKVGYEYINGNTTSCHYEFQNKECKDGSDKGKSMNKWPDESSEHSEASEDDNEPEDDQEVNQRLPETKIVGASDESADETKRKPGRPKKTPPRNPYGRKGKPTEKVELNLLEIDEPTNLKEALSSPQAKKWKDAIQEEVKNLERLETWEDAEPPPGKTCIGSK